MLQHGRAYSAYEFRRKNVCDNEMSYSITREGILNIAVNFLVYLDITDKTYLENANSF